MLHKTATAMIAEFMLLEQNIKDRNNVHLRKEILVNVLTITINEYLELDELQTDKILLKLIVNSGRDMKNCEEDVPTYTAAPTTEDQYFFVEEEDVVPAYTAKQVNHDFDEQLPEYNPHGASPAYTPHADAPPEYSPGGTHTDTRHAHVHADAPPAYSPKPTSKPTQQSPGTPANHIPNQQTPKHSMEKPISMRRETLVSGPDKLPIKTKPQRPTLPKSATLTNGSQKHSKGKGSMEKSDKFKYKSTNPTGVVPVEVTGTTKSVSKLVMHKTLQKLLQPKTSTRKQGNADKVGHDKNSDELSDLHKVTNGPYVLLVQPNPKEKAAIDAVAKETIAGLFTCPNKSPATREPHHIPNLGRRERVSQRVGVTVN